MASERDLIIRFSIEGEDVERTLRRTGAAARGLEGEVDDMGDAADRAERELDQLGREASETGTIFKTAIGNLAASAVEGLVGAMRSAISQGAQLVQMSAGLAETQSKFNTVFGQSRGAVQGFIDEWATMAGLTSGQAQELLATTGAIAQGAGLAEAESADLSMEVAKLAGDLASFNDASPEETFRAVQAAMTGEREQLKKYGIVLRETEVQQRALADTGKASAKSLTQREKALAGLALMSKKAGRQVGDLERTSDSAANQGKQARAAWASLAETAAEELLPAAKSLNAELLELAGREDVKTLIRETAQDLSHLLVRGIDLLTRSIELYAEYGEEALWAAQAAMQIVGAIYAYRAAVAAQTLVTQAAAIAQRGWNVAMKANPIGLIVAALAVVLPLLYQFRDRVAEAGAVFLDFSAKTVRAAGFLVDKMQALLAGLPAWVPGIAAMRVAVGALDVAVGKSADSLEAGADKLRSYADGVRGKTVTMQEAGAEMTKMTEKTDENTDATEDNTQATNESAEATERAKGALQEARAELLKFEGTLAGLEGVDLQRLVTLRAQTRQAKEQLDAYERMIEAMATVQAEGGVEILKPWEPPSEEDFRAQTPGRIEVPDMPIPEPPDFADAWEIEMKRARQTMTDFGSESVATFNDVATITEGAAGSIAGNLMQAFQAAGGAAEEFWVVYQAIAIAQAITDTYKAANAAYAAMAGIPVVGPGLGIAAAAAAVAAGLANVSKIASMSPPGADTSGGETQGEERQQSVRGYATGTDSAAAGWALVGEEGPELMRFGGGETVLTNDNARALAGLASIGAQAAARQSGGASPAQTQALLGEMRQTREAIEAQPSPIRPGELVGETQMRGGDLYTALKRELRDRKAVHGDKAGLS